MKIDENQFSIYYYLPRIKSALIVPLTVKPTKYRNPSNTIRVAVAISFTAKLYLVSPKIPAE